MCLGVNLKTRLTYFWLFPGGVCILASRNGKHRPVPALSQECAKRQVVQRRTLCRLFDEHHRGTEYGKDWQGVQLGRDWASLVEYINWLSGFIHLWSCSYSLHSILPVQQALYWIFFRTEYSSVKEVPDAVQTSPKTYLTSALIGCDT